VKFSLFISNSTIISFYHFYFKFTEPNDYEAELLKQKYYHVLFANVDESRNMHFLANVGISLFHFKKLASSILMEFKQNYMAKTNSLFRKEIEAKYAEYEELNELDRGLDINYYACIFFKFFMKLRRNEILTKHEEWNKYVRFRMRHFYWIDPNVWFI